MDLPTPFDPLNTNAVDNSVDTLTEEVVKRLAEAGHRASDSDELELSVESLLDRVQVLEERIAMNSMDSLTGVLASNHFFGAMEEILSRPSNKDKKFLVWQFDIDKFQSINNLYGVDEGNRLLVYCANHLKGYIPHTRDTAFGRVGGDMFCCILPFAPENVQSEADYEEVAKAWINGKSDSGGFEGFLRGFRAEFRFNVSIGFYVIEDSSEPIEIIYSRVLLATKSCKLDSQRSVAFYDKAMTKEVEDKQIITSEMHTALERGEFVVYLQPKVRISDMSLVGAEALVRWIHPKRGRVPPDDFIPLFEENGFITSMDLYVLRRCCNYLQSWFRQGLTPIPLSVNLSQKDLLTPNLAEKLVTILDQYDVPVRYIHLEITESAYASDEEGALKVTETLKNYGFHLEMDDFGKGYSSLNMIAQLPIDTLKLDMKFLEGDSANSGKVISFVTSLASHMDLVTVAEGIETQEQLDFLRSIRCDCGQGYFFSRPLEKADFDSFMRGCSIATPRRQRAGDASKVKMKQALTSMELWSPTSHFSHIFNSFTLGIGVCELNLITKKFRLVRSNDYFAHGIGATPEKLKEVGENLFDIIHKDDILKVMHSVQKVSDPKNWGVETGVFAFDLRVSPNLNANNYHWVNFKGKFIDFTTETRTYVVTAVDMNFHYDAMDKVDQRLSEVDNLQRQMRIYEEMGISGTATISFPTGAEPQIVAANNNFLKLHSIDPTKEEVAFPLSLSDIVAPESQAALARQLQTSIKSVEKSYEWSLEIVDTKGEARNLVANGFIRNESDGVYTDLIVSELKNESKLNTELAYKQEQSDLIIKNADITRINMVTGEITYGHDLQDAFGFPPAAYIGTDGALPQQNRYSPACLSTVSKMLAEIVATQKPREFELQFRHPGKSEFTTRKVAFWPEFNDEGDVVSVAGLGRPLELSEGGNFDITFADVINNMSDGIIVLNCSDHSLVFANKRYYEVVGITAEVLRSDYDNTPFNLVLAFNDNNHEMEKEDLESRLSEDKSMVFDARLKNQPLRWISYHATQKGQYYYIYCYDVTEKYEMQSKLDRMVWFNDVLNSISDELLFQADIKKSTISFSGYRAVTFGLAEQEIVLYPGCAIRGVITPDYISTYLGMVDDIKRGLETVRTIQLKDLQGGLGWYRFEYRIVWEDNEPTFAVGKGTNIDNEMSILSEIDRDPVTGCLAETSLQICVNQVLSTTLHDIIVFDDPEVSHTHALIKIVIENYNQLSRELQPETLGHYLADMANMITHAFRETDYLGRIAEDTFSIFIHGVGDRTQAEEKIQLIYRNINAFNREDPTLPPFNVELYVTYAPLKGTTYQTLIQNVSYVPEEEI